MGQFSVKIYGDTASALSAKQQGGGHVGISVQDFADDFLWIAEAKIHYGAVSTGKGFVQISHKYGQAEKNRNHGELLIFHRRKNSLTVLQAWAEELRVIALGIKISNERMDPSLFFRSEYTCPGSGLSFFTWHRILPLWDETRAAQAKAAKLSK